MKTLAVCIPTYKRPDFLRRCVDSAVIAAEGRPIDIVVAEDALDGTNDAVRRELEARVPNLRWHRNARNLGIDRNIQRAIDLCETRYAWPIGEDDLFVPGSIARVHDALRDDDVAFACANYQYVDATQSRVLKRVLRDLPDGRVDAAAFVREHLPSIGFIGACIVRRADWARTLPAPYDGTYFTHVGRIAEMLEASGVVRFFAEPAVSNRAQGEDTFTWKSDAFGVFTGFERMCRIAATRCPSLAPALLASAVAYRRTHAFLSLKTTFRLRSEGAFDLRQFRTYILPLKLSPARTAWMLALALAPRAALKPFAALFLAWRDRHAPSGGGSTP